MTITWDIKTEVVNSETDLRKIVAVRIDSDTGDRQTFRVKARMEDAEDVIYDQWLAAKAKVAVVDTGASTLKTNLEKREVS